MSKRLRATSSLSLVLILVLGAVERTARGAAAEPVVSEGGMVASSVGPATAIGRDVLARGGNAIDAAIATGLAAGCAHHFSSGIGGGGFFVVHIAGEKQSYALDAREVAPAAVTPTTFRTPDGRPDPQAARSGGKAVAVPGLVQGLVELHERFGKLEWSDVVEPAAQLCRDGVPIGSYHRAILQAARERLVERFPETARIQLDGGKVPALGWRLVQEDLARTYDRIAAQGVRAMTEGPIAEAIVKAVQEAGGSLALHDLATYRTRWREPLRGRYRGYDIVSMPPPSSGGIALIEMFHALEPFELRERGPNSSDTLHLLAGAMQLAFADRAVHLGDPEFHAVPIERLTSEEYGRELASRLRPPPFWRRPPWRWGRPQVLHLSGPPLSPVDDAGTTHISVIDREGNAVALTQTINTVFGSGITAPGTGIVLNNEMDDFAIAPNTPNAFQLLGSAANAVAPGKRPLSSMTPTLVMRGDRVVWAVGSPMGPYIITTVLQTLVNLIDFDMDVQAAVTAPRVHHQWRPDVLQLEPDHPRDVVDNLERMGHPVGVGGRTFGTGTVVERDPDTGTFFGAIDPRRDAGAAGP